jgi:hypothetical protein
LYFEVGLIVGVPTATPRIVVCWIYHVVPVGDFHVAVATPNIALAGVAVGGQFPLIGTAAAWIGPGPLRIGRV